MNTMNDDELTAKYTAFASMQELLTAKGGYRPSLRCESASGTRGRDLTQLANAYDAYQAARGDSRRAFRS